MANHKTAALEKKRMKLSETIGNRAWPGLTEHNNAGVAAIDKHNKSWNGKKYTHSQKGCGIKGCKYD